MQDKLWAALNTRGRGSTLLRSPACENNVPDCTTILRDNMSLTASLIKLEQRTSYVLFCSQSFVSQLQCLLTLAISLFPEAPVWAGKGRGMSTNKKNERTPRLALSFSLSLFSEFTDTPCFVSQRASKFPFGSASKCLSSSLYSLSTWHPLIKVGNSICKVIHHTSNVKMGPVFHVHQSLEKESGSSRTCTFIIPLLTDKQTAYVNGSLLAYCPVLCFSLRASSPIWANEASLARTRERGAEERRACNDIS